MKALERLATSGMATARPMRCRAAEVWSGDGVSRETPDAVRCGQESMPRTRHENRAHTPNIKFQQRDGSRGHGRQHGSRGVGVSCDTLPRLQQAVRPLARNDNKGAHHRCRRPERRRLFYAERAMSRAVTVRWSLARVNRGVPSSGAQPWGRCSDPTSVSHETPAGDGGTGVSTVSHRDNSRSRRRGGLSGEGAIRGAQTPRLPYRTRA